MKIPNFSKEEAEAPVDFSKYGIPEDYNHLQHDSFIQDIVNNDNDPDWRPAFIKIVFTYVFLIIGYVSFRMHEWVVFKYDIAALFIFWSIVIFLKIFKKS